MRSWDVIGQVGDTTVTNGTCFDHDANGFAEATGSVNARDGIRVLDRNANVNKVIVTIGAESMDPFLPADSGRNNRQIAHPFQSQQLSVARNKTIHSRL